LKVSQLKSQAECIYKVDKKFISSTERQMLIVLLLLMMEGENCIETSYKIISLYTGLSLNTSIKYIKSLEEKGFIHKTIRKREDKTKSFMPNLYHINFEALKSCQRKMMWERREKNHDENINASYSIYGD
jgi:hypothetical protein